MSRTPTPRSYAVGAALLGLAVVAPAAAPAKVAPPPHPRLVGTWSLDHDLSDNPRDRMRERRGDRRGGGGWEGRGGAGGGFPGGGWGRGGGGWGGGFPGGRERSAGRRPAGGAGAMLRGWETLTIAEDGPRMTLTGPRGETEVLFTDGRKMKADPAAVGLQPVKARWRDGRLEVKAKGARGGKLTETYDLLGDGHLAVTVETKGSGGRPGLRFRRVYDPVPKSAAR